MPSSVRAWRRSGAVVPGWQPGSPSAARRGSRSGSRRTTSDVAGPSSSASPSSGRSRRAGPIARTIGPVGLVDVGRPGGGTEHGQRLAQGADPVDRLVEKAGHPDPGRPVEEDRARPPMRRIVERGGKAGEGLVAPHELRARVRGRHDGIIRAASARLDRHDRHPEPAASRQHAQRAARRGVAVLHQVAADHGLPVRAGPRRPEGPWREQAAAPDGPPDRVLQPDRRARARPLRRGRRHAPRGGHRARPAPGARDRARAALGDRVRVGRPRPRRPSATGWAPSSRTSARPTRAGREASTQPGWSCASATRWRSCRRSTTARSTWSPPIRRTTCSCR